MKTFLPKTSCHSYTMFMVLSNLFTCSIIYIVAIAVVHTGLAGFVGDELREVGMGPRARPPQYGGTQPTGLSRWVFSSSVLTDASRVAF